MKKTISIRISDEDVHSIVYESSKTKLVQALMIMIPQLVDSLKLRDNMVSLDLFDEDEITRLRHEVITLRGELKMIKEAKDGN